MARYVPVISGALVAASLFIGFAFAGDLTTQPIVSAENSNLSTLQHAYRASAIIGSTVVNDKKEPVGKINDLLINQRDYVPYAVISIGGFLGFGKKLVAIPYRSLSVDGNKLMLPNVTEETLMSQVEFHYLNQ